MTELERARVHLCLCQDDLYYARLHLPGSIGAYKVAERHFLAALSWVWDAQERAKPSTPVWFGWDLAKKAGGRSVTMQGFIAEQLQVWPAPDAPRP